MNLGAVFTTAPLLAAAAAGALVLSAATGLPLATSLLALAPGGVTEMVPAVSPMDLDVPVITAFHVTCIVLVTSSVLLIFRLFNSVGTGMDRALGSHSV